MRRSIFLMTFTILALTVSCTEDFSEINEKPNALTAEDVSAKYFLTNLQQQLFAPNRYPYWRGPIIHADRYAGHTTFGFSACWWNDGLGYVYSPSYTDVVHDFWMSGYNSLQTGYMNFVQEGGVLENTKYEAIGLIMKGLYYQYFTDIFGMVPFSEASNPDITTPKYDTQKDIYKGIIDDLDQAISMIGGETSTGSGADALTDNDLFFGGDLQSWKQLANSLKLRLGLRANGAAGDDFSASAITEAITGGVLATRDATIKRDLEISTWVSAVYGDVWGPFYGGGHWNLSKTLIDALRDNNDPRLTRYARPSDGGIIKWTRPTEGDNVALFEKHTSFLTELLDNSGATYTINTTADGLQVDMPAGVNYVGQPTRLNGKIKPYLDTNLFSKPAEIVVNQHNSGKPIFPFIVMTAAESHFMIAEAIVKGLASGDAQSYYQTGLRHAMRLWEVPDGEIESFISSESMALLNGSSEENLEKIATQRWMALFTNGFEAWSIVRDSGYPNELASGVNDLDIYELGDLNGDYPQRMRYGNGAYNTNGQRLNEANAIQGPDKQATRLWWAKN